MAIFIAFAVLAAIAVPMFYSWRIATVAEASTVEWMLKVIEASSITALVILIGRWDIGGVYTRLLLAIIFAMALAISLHRQIRIAPGPPRGPSPTPWRSAISALVFTTLFIAAVANATPRPKPLELTFPLEGGRFIVGQGGAIGILNYHASHRAQRYAADITALNWLGFRATGPLPSALARYAVFNAIVVSPCSGVVIEARDGLPDLQPPARDEEHPSGNHVVVRCHGVNVELAHLQNGSITIETGDALTAGQRIARVGNSGNTSEPHLHIHAVDPDTGAGAPVSFTGRAPIRNRIYAVP